MNTLDAELHRRLADLSAQGLHRELRRVDSPQSTRIQIDGKTLLNFSSNDYLGLANERVLKAAAAEAAGRYGSGAGASRLVCGSLAVHHELDESIAEFKDTEAALSFPTGYAAALGTIGALMGKDDVIVIDKLVHACIVDAARLCGAKLRVFAHNELDDLEAILKWTRRTGAGANQRVLVATESVFSMDGDHAPLRNLVALKEKYGAWLMVDEAHATGIYGHGRRGLAEELGVSHQIEVQMGTLGKALGAAGGYICGSRVLVDYLVNRARTFIFSTAPVPAAVAAAQAGIRFAQSTAGADRCRSLWQRVGQLLGEAPGAGKAAPDCPLPAEASGAAVEGSSRSKSAIVPIIIGGEDQAVSAAASLREHGIFIPAIRYPTVARGTARLRLTVTAAHTAEDIEQLLSALATLGVSPGRNFSTLALHASAGQA